MVFGEPVYNSGQRRAALAEFKRYIDEKWKVVKTKRKKVKRIKRNNLAIKLYKRRKRRRKTKRRGRR